MGSWDYYCALCGSTFFPQSCVAEKPRSALFRRRRQREALQRARQKARDQGEDSKSDPSPLDDAEIDDSEDEENDIWEEENHYDCEVISQEEIDWASKLQCLGFNDNAPGLSKVFLWGPGRASDYGGVSLEGDQDGTLADGDALTAYHSFASEPPIFPFHYPCLDILLQVLSHKTGLLYRTTGQDGEFDVEDGNVNKSRTLSSERAPFGPKAALDKDLLYNIFREHAPDICSRLEGIDYGEPDPPDEQFWEARFGQEVLVAHPMQQNDLVVAMIHDAWVNSCTIVPPATPRLDVQRDNRNGGILSKLPVELLLFITTALDPMDLIDLTQASPHIRDVAVHSGASNPSFWLPHFKSCMPWFTELNVFLQGTQDQSYTDRSFHRLFVWASHVTQPHDGMEGVFLGVANRRRIWGICSQIADIYIPRSKNDTFSHEPFVNSIRNSSRCVSMPVVSFPEPSKVNTETTFWVSNISDIAGSGLPAVLDFFWSSEKSLIGISLNRNGVKALFGHDTGWQGVNRDSMTLEAGDWIEGLVLHFPQIVHTDVVYPAGWWLTAKMNTSIKAVSVRLRSGKMYTSGQVDQRYAKRLLVAEEGSIIVGLTGQIGTVTRHEEVVAYPEKPTPTWDVERITRLGIVQALDNASDSEYETDEKTLPSSVAWDEDYGNILQNWGTNDQNRTAAIWDVPELRLARFDQDTISSDVPDDIVCHSALLWGINETERASMVSLSAYHKPGGTFSGSDENHNTYSYTCDTLCGIKVEFTAKSGIEARKVGLCWNPSDAVDDKSHCDQFSIDGPGGERVTSISAYKGSPGSPKAIKLRTNRAREVYYGERDRDGGERNDVVVLQTPDPSIIVGLALTFADPVGYDHETKVHSLHDELCSRPCHAAEVRLAVYPAATGGNKLHATGRQGLDIVGELYGLNTFRETVQPIVGPEGRWYIMGFVLQAGTA